MQEHYLNTKKSVKGDTIPDKEILDLSKISAALSRRKKIVWFCARNGIRISVRVKQPIKYLKNGDILECFKDDLEPVSLVIDGGNFSLAPEVLIKHYNNHKSLYTEGNGSYLFCHVWETRLSKILYDEGFVFFDKHRNLKIKSVDGLWEKFPYSGVAWHYFYNIPHAYFYYGQDLYKSVIRFEYLRHLRDYMKANRDYDKDTSLRFYHNLVKSDHDSYSRKKVG